MQINVDIVEVYNCGSVEANILLKNGWFLMHSYTVIRGEVDGIPDSSVNYSLGRPSSVQFTLEMLDATYKPLF